jgi:membrane-bound ClpP family serine protease
MGDATPRGDDTARLRLVCRVAVAAVLLGVFVTWVAHGPVRLEGTQGPNNGWLALIVAGLALMWIRMLGSWLGLIGGLGAGLVIGWTALENWLDARAVLDASAAPGLLLVFAGSAILTTVAVVRAVELTRCALRQREASRAA